MLFIDSICCNMTLSRDQRVLHRWTTSLQSCPRAKCSGSMEQLTWNKLRALMYLSRNYERTFRNLISFCLAKFRIVFRKPEIVIISPVMAVVPTVGEQMFMKKKFQTGKWMWLLYQPSEKLKSTYLFSWNYFEIREMKITFSSNISNTGSRFR